MKCTNVHMSLSTHRHITEIKFVSEHKYREVHYLHVHQKSMATCTPEYEYPHVRENHP